MRPDNLHNLLGRGQHVMTVCNACRYCEAYCPVFPAMENRLVFSKGDLTYLANLCHNCGECLYACQYAPPHEFGINVPTTLAQIRGASYEEYCWPRFLSVAFTRQPSLAMVAVSLGFIAILQTARPLETTPAGGDFYRVIPHHVLVALFVAVSAFVVTALAVGCSRFWRDVGPGRLSAFERRPIGAATLQGLRDAFTLRHLHGGGVDCTGAPDTRTPWRRWCHHATFYGFVLCFASTSVAAFYHQVLGWRAPYSYASLPVALGTLGGCGLVAGPAGLLALRRRRDEALGDPTHRGLDTPLVVLLLLTSLTGFLLLVLRDGPSMPTLLIVHLSLVLALLLTLPYGKFVHGVYRTAALIKFAAESDREHEVG